ncbi:PASTA domain-containing protein [uncultured Duncaniella sp.]|uniref:PASTA domain-containing protein n=1 Tax=uncultured Duncaniella sp. TaxID=2768039 RepID=UPI002647A757|nr:PASTA domain-containing protein [uncultured Duncaniella sp.]
MRTIFINIGLMIVAALVIGWLSMLWLDSWTRHGDTISVPAVRTLAYNKAMDILNAEGLKGIVADSVYDNLTAPGTVIEQNPKAGTIVKEGREVFLTIHAFSPKMVTLPSLTDISLRQARSILEGLDIKNIVERRVPSEFKDLVLAVRYKGARLQAGARVPAGARIELEVGEGVQELIPDSVSADTDAVEINPDLF